MSQHIHDIERHRIILGRNARVNELCEQEEFSQSLLRLSKGFEVANDYSSILNIALDEVRNTLGYQSLWVYLLTEDKKQMKLLIAGGGDIDALMAEAGTATLQIEGDQMLEEIATANDIVLVEDARYDERTNKEIVDKMGIRTLINIPIRLFDKNIGSVGTGTLGAEGGRVPSNSGRKYLMALASHMAVSLDRIRLLSERNATEKLLRHSLHELEAKEQAKTRFLAAAGHDLRQPLAAANLFIDALRLTQPTADQDRIIQRLDIAMSNFTGLLDALLNVSKLDAGIIKPAPTIVDSADVFSWLDKSFKPLAEDKHIRFKLLYPKYMRIVVHSDLGLLQSVLMNLVSNAIKYTSKGAIIVSLRERGGDVLFQVWDTGIGISDENSVNIFDEFYQVDNTQRDRTKGLGLGLPIAKRTASLLGGKISFRSQIGRGSVFTFQLPKGNVSNKERPVSIMSLSKQNLNDDFVHGKHFIVVEDDSMISESLRLALESMGGTVDTFFDASSALQYPGIDNADCYIVDFMLPGDLDGANFLQRLKQNTPRHVCAVMMTGDTSTDFVGAMDTFDWPVMHKPASMKKMISHLVEQYEKYS